MGLFAKATQAVSSQTRPQSRLNSHLLMLLDDNEPQSLGLPSPATNQCVIWRNLLASLNLSFLF